MLPLPLLFKREARESRRVEEKNIRMNAQAGGRFIEDEDNVGGSRAHGRTRVTFKQRAYLIFELHDRELNFCTIFRSRPNMTSTINQVYF